MRNLHLLNSISLPCFEELENTQCLSVDCDTGVIYCASSRQIVGIDPRSQQVTGIVSLVDDDYMPADGSGKIVGLQYLPDQQAVCAATSSGNLLLWNVMMGQLECVGNVESGFTAMSWSPDMELVILTTGQDTLIMMTREFDPITEKSLHPEEFGEAEFVNVGWGKKETQFHGSEGKEAAQCKKQDVKPAFPWDDKLPRMSWRGDGQCFAVGTISPDTGSRKMRVWSRDCVHQSTSENIAGIEQALAWKPSGSLIASTIRRPNKHEVIFFEKNGLHHGEFTLPFGVKDVKVKEVLWNMESTVLAVWCEDLLEEEANKVPKSYVQLWTCGNYHWYLKQSLHFNGLEKERVVAVEWDPEQAYRLHIICGGGKYLQYTWSWATISSTGKSEDDPTIVSVIDGENIIQKLDQQLFLSQTEGKHGHTLHLLIKKSITQGVRKMYQEYVYRKQKDIKKLSVLIIQTLQEDASNYTPDLQQNISFNQRDNDNFIAHDTEIFCELSRSV